MVRRKVPVDLIFSQENIVESNNKYYRELSRWQNIPIVNLEPYEEVLRRFLGDRGPLDKYLDFERKRRYPEKVEPIAIEKQIRRQVSGLRRLFRRELPRAERFERDRLVLRDGNILCCLAKLKNVEWIDILMPEDVAVQWDSRPTTELDAEIARQRRTVFYTPIMHEKYRKWKVSRRGTKRLDLMRRFLGPVHKRLSLLDIGCNTGFYTFHFYRQGFETTGIDFDPDHLAIAQAQCSMYSADNIPFELCALHEFKSHRRFDIVLGLSVFWHMLGWGSMSASITPERLGQKLEELVGYALFWEGGKRSDEEIEIIKGYSPLRYYTQLGRTAATGIENREFGVFTRCPATEVRQIFNGSVACTK
jgi:SAM-dependent methyltransferase